MSDYLIHKHQNHQYRKFNKLELKQQQLSLNYQGIKLEQKKINSPKTPKAYNQMSTQTYQGDVESIEIQNLELFKKHQNLLTQLENCKQELKQLQECKERVEQQKDLSEEIEILKQELGTKYEVIDLEDQERCIKQLEREDQKYKDILNQRREQLQEIEKLVQKHLEF